MGPGGVESAGDCCCRSRHGYGRVDVCGRHLQRGRDQILVIVVFGVRAGWPTGGQLVMVMSQIRVLGRYRVGSHGRGQGG